MLPPSLRFGEARRIFGDDKFENDNKLWAILNS
jgi:hypothetical protein